MRKLNIEFTTYSPLFIGSNETIPSFGYIGDDKNKTIKIIDFDALVSSINDLKIVDTLTKELNKDPQNFFLERFSKDYGIKFEEFIKEEIEIHDKDEFFRQKQESENRHKSLNINRFIRNANGYYIPGSSIKGAFETALEYWYYSEKIDKFIKAVNDVFNNPKNKRTLSNNLDKELNKRLKEDFERRIKIAGDNKITENNKTDNKVKPPDPFSLLGFTDSPSFGSDKMSIFIVKRKRVYGDRNEKGIPVCSEGVREGVNFSVTMTFDEAVFGENTLFEAVKKFSNDIIEDDSKIPMFTLFYNKFKQKLNGNNNLFPLNLGFGGSLKTKTLYLLLKSAYTKNQLRNFENDLRRIYNIKNPNNDLFGSNYPSTRNAIEELDRSFSVPGWVIFKI
jgi:CRISPR type III-A-associated RAMP protein Csm5